MQISTIVVVVTPAVLLALGYAAYKIEEVERKVLAKTNKPK